MKVKGLRICNACGHRIWVWDPKPETQNPEFSVFRDWHFRSRGWNFKLCRLRDLGFRLLGFRVWGLGLRVWAVGLRV